MHNTLSLFIKLAIAGGCLTYALWGVDFTLLGQAIMGYSPFRFAVVCATMLLLLVFPGVRLRFLCGRDLGVWNGSKASALALGLNNVFPAKLGEVAKAVYVSRKCGFSTAKGLGLIFWERFFDVNMVLCLAVVSIGVSQEGLPIWPGLAFIVAVWLCIAGLTAWPHLAKAALSLVPVERLRLFAWDFLGQLRERVGVVFFVKLGLATVFVWGSYFLVCLLCLVWLAGLQLGFFALLVTFVIASLGMAVPSTPAGIGVYEAAVVFALGLFGVDKESALAAGLVMHMAQIIPVTLAGTLVLATSDLRLGQLRKSEV